MKIGNRKAEKPRLEHIIGNENPVLSIFLRGHLVLESLINQILLVKKLQTARSLEALNCHAKISQLHREKLFSKPFFIYLKTVNRLRNEFAHKLGYDLTETDVHELIKLAGQAPEVDFSDDMHTLHIDTLYEWYGDTCGVLCEMFKHVAMDLGFMLMEQGGELPFEN